MKKQYEQDPFNGHQNFLYNRALYGLSIYAPEEIKEMPVEKKKRIVRIHKKAQTVINLWKQEIVNAAANRFFTNIFPDMEITHTLVNYYGIEGDPEHVNNLSFKMLKISKQEVVNKLIEKKVLPKNFNQLKQDESRVPSKRGVMPSVKPGHNIGRRVA
jgi:hypothetical protein